MERYVVIFYGVEDEKMIEDLGGVIIDSIPFIDNMLIADLPKEAVESLLEDERIERLEKEHVVEPSNVNYDSYDYNYGYCEGYHCLPLKLRDYWTRGVTGSGIKIGIVDSGVFPNTTLPPLSGGFTGNSSNPYNLDANGHGTHIAGIIAGKHTGGGSFRGVAPDAKIYSIRVDLNDGTLGFSSTYILSGINYAIQQGLHILNCSFSTSSSSASYNTALQQAVNNGMVVVAATSNEGESLPRYPARLSYVWGIINVNKEFERNSSSNYGEGSDFAVYGTGIIATKNADSGMVAKTGTSMATPIIVGITALYKQLFPTLTVSQLKQKMIDNCTNKVWSSELAWGAPMPPTELYNNVISVSMPRQSYFSKNGNLVPLRFYKNTGTQTSPVFTKITPKVKVNDGFVDLV